MAETAPDVLYHYCSLDTFYNIMKNQSIWLSDVSKSNDSQELNWLTKQLKNKMGIYFFEFYDRVRERNQSVLLDTSEYKEIRDYIENCDLSEVLKCWAFCMTEKKDDLGQWRGYADNGSGLAIGFRHSYFEINSAFNSVPNLDGVYYLFNNINYDELDIIGMALTREEFNEIKNTFDITSFNRNIKTAFKKMLPFAPLYKNSAFREENEWRFAVVTFMENLLLEEFNFSESSMLANILSGKFRFQEYEFLPKAQTLVSHVGLKIEDMKSAICSVTIGPKSKLREIDIQLFLISLGLLKSINDKSIKVSRSSASYR